MTDRRDYRYRPVAAPKVERQAPYHKAHQNAVKAEEAYEAAVKSGNFNRITAAAEAWARLAQIAFDSAHALKNDRKRGPAIDQATAMKWRAEKASTGIGSDSFFDFADEPVPPPSRDTRTPRESIFSKEKAVAFLRDKSKQAGDALTGAWGQRGAALLAGVVAGAGGKQLLHMLNAGTGVGYAGSIAFGAVYGAITAGAIEYGKTYSQHKANFAEYNEFARDMDAYSGNPDESELRLWVRKVNTLKDDLASASTEADKKALERQIHYAMVYARDTGRKEGMSIKKQAKLIVDEMFGFDGNRAPSTADAMRHSKEQERVVKELKAGRHVNDYTQMWKAIRRGAIFGAVGAATLGFSDAVALDGVSERVEGMLTSARELASNLGIGDAVDGASVPEIPEINSTPEIPDASETLAPAEIPVEQDVDAATVSESANAESATAESPAETGTPSEVVEASQTTIALAEGSNPWNSVEASLGFNPTNAEMVQIMSRVAQDSGFSVSEWGITTGPDDQALQAGFEIKISAETQAFIASLRS